MNESTPLEGSSDTFLIPAKVVLFGYPDTPAKLELRRRDRRWRVGGAVRLAATGVLLAPMVGLVPPHAPWAVGALAGGGILAQRRLKERYTVERVEGTCPRCGGALGVRRGRLRSPHPVPCDGCHHECALSVDAAAVERADPAGDG